MNSWNGHTSYALNMKLYNLGLTSEQEDKAYDLIDFDEAGWYIKDCIADFKEKWPSYTAGFNGRSGGYLVLYYKGPGRDLTQEYDFTEWYKAEVAEVVELLKDFHELADNLLTNLLYMIENYNIVEEEYTITQTRKVLVEAV